MIDRCECCYKTSAQIDSLEFELEAKNKLIKIGMQQLDEALQIDHDSELIKILEAIDKLTNKE